MTYSTNKSRLARALATALSAAIIGGLSLVGATQAMAANAPGYYSISGVVNTPDGGGVTSLEGVEASVTFTEPGSSQSRYATLTGADGTFQLDGIPAGDYTVVFIFNGYGSEVVEVTIADADKTLPPVTILPLTDATLATAAIAGTGLVGETLTVTTTGWPAGTEFTYQWFAPQAYQSGDIAGATSSTYVVTENEIGRSIWVWVIGEVPGISAPTQIDVSNGIAITAPKKAPAPAPTDLAAYLLANGSTPEPQTSTGLPAGALDTSKAHTANVPWFSPDSFVDVYAFSTPVFVGTFPVVNGVAQITLSTAVLGQLAAGNHTLVITGQSSGAVQSVALAVGLPATGNDPTVPVIVASLLTLLGAGLMFVRRQYGARV